jgi:hypothetical protein
VSDPEFQKRHMIARGLSPALNTPEQFVATLKKEAAMGRDVVKGSGLYPDLKIN